MSSAWIWGENCFLYSHSLKNIISLFHLPFPATSGPSSSASPLFRPSSAFPNRVFHPLPHQTPRRSSPVGPPRQEETPCCVLLAGALLWPCAGRTDVLAPPGLPRAPPLAQLGSPAGEGPRKHSEAGQHSAFRTFIASVDRRTQLALEEVEHPAERLHACAVGLPVGEAAELAPFHYVHAAAVVGLLVEDPPEGQGKGGSPGGREPRGHASPVPPLCPSSSLPGAPAADSGLVLG